MKNNLVIACLMSFNIMVFGQPKEEITSFIVEKPLYVGKDSLLYKGMGQEFCVYRKYLDSRTFVERNLSYFSDDIFRIKRKRWYIKKNGRWELFFSKKKFQKKKEIINGNRTIRLIPDSIYTSDTQRYYVYRFEIAPESKNESLPVDYILFSAEKGIVKIYYAGI